MVKNRRCERIAVLLSGGVDSAVALALLREAGHKLTAFYLKIWLEDDLSFLGSCPWDEDISYAQTVCNQLDVPLKIVPFQDEYRQEVVEYMISALRAGKTPSPDVLCNRAIKFGAFIKHIAGSYDAVASGHYARVVRHQTSYQLWRGVDLNKDQSYFLSYLDPEHLRSVRFPLGEFQKAQVRSIAKKRLLSPSDRKDSQGICFLGKISYSAFVRSHLGELPGDIREKNSGFLLGRHRGHWFHTIGQRQGLGLSNGPWYVVSKDVSTNMIFVASNPIICAPKMILLTRCNWLTPLPLFDQEKIPVLIRFRHGDRLHLCCVSAASETETGSVRLFFEKPQPGLASGQFAVLYGFPDGTLCYGAGVMESDFS